AEAGIDTEFGRGSTPEDRFLGDASVTPNPCLRPLSVGPFYAVPVHCGALGTSGGLRNADDGRAVELRVVPIDGRDAAGNDSAAVFHGAYPGGGATLGSAVVRAFVAGCHIAGRRFAGDDPAQDDRYARDSADAPSGEYVHSLR